MIIMRIVLVLAFFAGLLVSASGEPAFLPDLLSSQNHMGCFSTTSLSKHSLFKDLEVCVRNCTKNLTESEEVTPCTHNCGASITNLVGVQISKAKSSPLFFCFCGNKAKLRLLEKVSGCQCCPDTADRFCGGEKAISIYNISDSSMTTMQSIPEAVKTSIHVPHQTHKYMWYSSTVNPGNEESTAYSSQTITENSEQEDQLATDQESITDDKNYLEPTTYDQSNVELTTETLTTDLQIKTETATHATTSTRSTTYMTTEPELVTNLDNQEPTQTPNLYTDSDIDDYSEENGRNNNPPVSNYGDETYSEISTETASPSQSSQDFDDYSEENGRNNNPPESNYGDETYLEISTETASPSLSSQGKPWELWVIVVLSGLSILTTGAVIILVSFLRTRLHERELYV